MVSLWPNVQAGSLSHDTLTQATIIIVTIIITSISNTGHHHISQHSTSHNHKNSQHNAGTGAASRVRRRSAREFARFWRGDGGDAG